MEISVPFLDSGLSDWLLNLHVAAGDWPIFTVGCTKIFRTITKPPFSNRLRPDTDPASAKHTPETSADSFLRLMRTAATVRVAPEVRTQHQSRKLSR